MNLANCGLCPWEIAQPTAASAQAALARHERLRHPSAALTAPQDIPADERRIPQLVSADWMLQGLDVIAAQPAGRRFTLYEVCAHLGEPPTVNGWQNLARDAHHLGLTRDVGGVASKRPGTKRSKTTLWERTTARRSA